MAMSKGTVSVDDAGAATGDGAAKMLYDIYITKLGDVIPGGATGVAAKRRIADLCDTFAELIDYIKTNGEITVTVGTEDAGLQRDPAGSLPTLAPAAPVVLATKGTIG